ncbi:hypothetical protein LshimejAT787_1000770 [Lyophyllum shimeji]|uniref:Uncharacterized protein n=1 Tax=Lyophyllum shimeji TaxID=47721 RepID=A0A9P3PUC3_LYOSH|nr:hypothetical protein LshimejAT787_1000770 [Lyophyllum shimeji]
MAPSEKTLELVTVMCESMLVGVYAVLTALVIWLLSTKHRTMPTMHKMLFGASIIMFFISVAHLALVMAQLASSKLSKQNAQGRIILSAFQFMIGDLVLIWRVWVVWGRNYWVAAPPLAIMIVAASLTFNLASHKQFTTFFTVAPSALVVANTTICTLLIAGKIWYARYQLRSTGGGVIYAGGAFNGTVVLFIETGALYATVQIISLVLDHVKSEGIHVLLDLEMPLIGILPTLIIVFVHFQLIGATGPKTVPTSRMQFEDSNQVNLDTFTSSMTARGEMDRDAKSSGHSKYGLSTA